MWIKSEFGLFNTDCVLRFSDQMGCTYAYSDCNKTGVLVSKYPVSEAIAVAIQSDAKYLEVE